MIGHIINSKEVEQGIREAAEDRARRLYPQPAMHEMSALYSWCVVDVDRVLARDARPAGVAKLLSQLDTAGLHWLYVAAFGDEMQARCEDEEEKRIDAIAAAVLCRHCSHPFEHPEHAGAMALLERVPEADATPPDHLFVCPHGEELITPRDCVTDHGPAA